MQRDSMKFDIVIVGAGPAGLSAAIRIKQLCQQHEKELSVCVIEKAAEVGGHILSGAVLEPSALAELFPDWQALNVPTLAEVTSDTFLFLTKRSAWRMPVPSPMKNHGNIIISLGQFCRWLAKKAQSLGVEIYPGFAAADFLLDDDEQVCGVITGDMGINKDGSHSQKFQAGMALRANMTILSEGCRGSLSERIIKKFKLREDKQQQTYGIGLKEIWQVDNEHHNPGSVIHSVGWPLDHSTYGGSFLYHLDNHQIATGFVIGLDYKNPYLDPFEEFQRFKTHPRIRQYFTGGERIAYGARSLNEGGFQSIPKLEFPGGVLIGCSAGFLNVPKIKGIHTAMKSAIIAAESIFDKITIEKAPLDYEKRLQSSPVWDELRAVRNIRPAFKSGLFFGLAYAAIETYLLRGFAPWTLTHHDDSAAIEPAKNHQKINYPKADNVITFDKLSSVYLSNTFHDENQPCHLTLKNTEIPINNNLALFDSPESRYCPAKVFEIVYTESNKAELVINAQNCIHCKTCDIKDPAQNIVWIPPEGGGGPNYTSM